MSSLAIATYLPDCQVITLTPAFAAFDDPENLRGIVGPDQIGFFFHEWVHYLHNVSTLQGLSAFANFVHLWQAFRNTIGSDGLSAGSNALSHELALNIRQKVMFMAAIRKRRQNNLPSNVRLTEIEFTSINPRDSPIEGTSVHCRTIICQILVLNPDGGKAPYVFEVGTSEILEAVAFMLEERLMNKFGVAPQAPPFDPYFLVPAIATHIVPGISSDVVLMCALASLQDSDPPGVLLDIFNRVRVEMERGNNPLVVLKDTQKQLLLACQQWVESTLTEVENAFPNDEPMARAVKTTTQTIRQNFVYRNSSPFLELELVDKIASTPSSLDEIVKTHGACAIIQQRLGLPDDIDRDLMYDFVLIPEHDDELSFGWRMMHAAFRFVGLHFTNDSILATAALPQAERLKCPFYTACSFRFRQERPVDCATRPWLSSTMDVNELCWYGRAVYAIAPPSRRTTLLR